LELKKRKPAYNPNDVDESGEKRILAQYDEEIDGEKNTHFTLDSMGSTTTFAAMNASNSRQGSKGVIVSLDILNDQRQPISDYVDASEIKIKKPKKKKKSSTRKKSAEEDDIAVAEDVTAMDVDLNSHTEASNSKKRSIDEANFVDDDDLQARLAQQRREALKKKKRIRPEDLAKQLREEEESAMDGVVEGTEENGLVLNETTEFVGHLQPEVEEGTDSKKGEQKATSEERQIPDEDNDVEMEQSYAAVADKVTTPTEDKPEPPLTAEISATGLDEEGTITRGLGSTLAMLRQRKVLENDDHGDLNVDFRQHEHFLAERRSRQLEAEKRAKLQRERDRQSGTLNNMSSREREDYARQNNTMREQMESQAMIDLFNKEYKPNLDIKYVDEFGRRMGQKEAFKHLSHQFHGKGSGKQKHEKRLRKIEEEKKREAMSTLDSSVHVQSTAMSNKAKKNQTPGVRLQ
jgi:U4/U6.U5 tri-snRNP-associated protein 1